MNAKTIYTSSLAALRQFYWSESRATARLAWYYTHSVHTTHKHTHAHTIHTHEFKSTQTKIHTLTLLHILVRCTHTHADVLTNARVARTQYIHMRLGTHTLDHHICTLMDITVLLNVCRHTRLTHFHSIL